jgi:hypothetical protein
MNPSQQLFDMDNLDGLRHFFASCLFTFLSLNNLLLFKQEGKLEAQSK